MMKRGVHIRKGSKHIKTRVDLPASKSLSNRLLIIKALCKDNFIIKNLSGSGDTIMLQKSLENTDSINSIDINDAGTVFRFLTAFFCVLKGTRTLSGNKRMLVRPIAPLVDTLNELGGKISYSGFKGYPPILINGTTLEGGKASIDAHISSQFVSALLLIAPTMKKGLELELKRSVASEPYIRMTLDLMRYYGIESEWDDNIIKIVPQKYEPKNITVEADWSAAAFWYEMAALSEHAEIELMGLQKNSMQGDNAIAEIYENIGVETTYLADSILLRKSARTIDFLELDFFAIPDVFPSLVACCAGLNLPFRFTGLQNLSIKESDRVEAMICELGKFGYEFEYEKPAVLSFNGLHKKPVKKHILCETQNDHRIAMALAPLSLLDFNLNITDSDCVNKSYPDFFNHLKNAGFSVEDFWNNCNFDLNLT